MFMFMYSNKPCLLAALDFFKISYPKEAEEMLTKSGYASISVAKKITGRKVNYCHKKSRILLRDFLNNHLGEKMIVLIKGHWFPFNGTNYYSFVPHDYEEVIAYIIL